jgi:hypothetical protein
MAFAAKKLFQGALSTAVTARFTNINEKTGYVSEIWLANTGTTDRAVTIYAHGSAVTNLLATIIVPANGFVVLQALKIILTGTEALYAKQDVGTDITMTVYGGDE